MNTEIHRRNVIINCLKHKGIPIEVIDLYILPFIDRIYLECNTRPISLSNEMLQAITLHSVKFHHKQVHIINLPTKTYMHINRIFLKFIEISDSRTVSDSPSFTIMDNNGILLKCDRLYYNRPIKTYNILNNNDISENIYVYINRFLRYEIIIDIIFCGTIFKFD